MQLQLVAVDVQHDRSRVADSAVAASARWVVATAESASAANVACRTTPRAAGRPHDRPANRAVSNTTATGRLVAHVNQCARIRQRAPTARRQARAANAQASAQSAAGTNSSTVTGEIVADHSRSPMTHHTASSMILVTSGCTRT